MSKTFSLILLSLLMGFSAAAQESPVQRLNIGDIAPRFKVKGWLKGIPVKKLEKGQVYVLEFWATWCKPCLARMPHLSALATQYKDKIHFIGIDVYEPQKNSIERLKKFVDSLGSKVDFPVAVTDGNTMLPDWLLASAEESIPVSFVIDAEGRISFIGYPTTLDFALPKILDGTWDRQAALNKRLLESCLETKDRDASYDLLKYAGDPRNPADMGKPDSMLLAIAGMVQKDPEIKYMPSILAFTFSSLLKTDPHKAYLYAKEMMASMDPEDVPQHMIFANVQFYSDKLNLPDEVYELGIESLQSRIRYSPETAVPEFYHELAGFYSHLKQNGNAALVETRAITVLKKGNFKVKEKLPGFQADLEKYLADRNKDEQPTWKSVLQNEPLN